MEGTSVPQGPQSFSICISSTILSDGVTISLPGGAPAIVAPNTATPISVEIFAIGESLVGGSETLHYRYDGGAFQTSTLTPLGGGLYQATLPPAGCSDEPEFYFSAIGTVSGTVTLPAGGSVA